MLLLALTLTLGAGTAIAGGLGIGGAILWTQATGAWEMHGCIYNDYLHKPGFGGPAGQFGCTTASSTAIYDLSGLDTTSAPPAVDAPTAA